jgi:hypothetical protein
MFDVFYSGIKPNVVANEQPADSIEHARKLSRTRSFWWINYLTDYSGFDFLFEPVPWQAEYTHVWPSPWPEFHGCCLVPTNTDSAEYHYHSTALPAREYPENFVTLLPCEFDYSWVPPPWDPPYIYVFGNQWWSAVKQPTVEYHAPGATQRKYVDFPRAELLANMDHWTVPPDIDTAEFDFSWRPDPADPPYRYQFGTQHQRTGGPEYCVPGAVDIKFVDQIRARTSSKATARYEIDHLDGNAGQIPATTRTVRYFDNYLDTLRRIANTCEHEFVWICSSICDYTEFDFSWHPEYWQATMLHVFPSSGEKFGDTFFMHVPTFKSRAARLELLDWYDINYTGINVPRRPLPVVHHSYDTHVEAVKTVDWPGPLALFTVGETVEQVPTVPLWREKTKTIVPLSEGASVCIVPKVAVPYIKRQLYDYPNIDRRQRHMCSDEPLDIVFIDNGEPNADANYKLLHYHTSGRLNRLHRSSGVTGRVAAYHAAARSSTTPWFFAVFAKLQVDPGFDWSWQPDRLQEPKHYIFHAVNPVNGLVYGHQAMIAYNRELVLNNPGQGLDFTLDSAHEVVPVVSGTAEYANSLWSAWRTAFRECIKLRASADVESQYRLDKWLTVNLDEENLGGEYSRYGAQDAVEYYEAVGGDVSELRKSYDWAWLATYAMIKRNLTPDR